MPPTTNTAGTSHEPRVLNVAEKPSVARSLAAAFARRPGARDGGMTRLVHQVFTCHACPFPPLHTQGQGVELPRNNNHNNATAAGGRCVAMRVCCVWGCVSGR